MDGVYCDHCSVGTLGNPPYCQKCGECYDNWNREIARIAFKMDHMENRALDLFTFKKNGDMEFTEFTATLDDLEVKISDFKKLIDVDYNQENISLFFEKIDLLKSQINDRLKMSLQHTEMLGKWQALQSLFDTVKEKYPLIQKNTNVLLRKSFDLRETDVNGALLSIENSQIVSNKATQTLLDIMPTFHNYMHKMSTDISHKLNELEIESYKTVDFDNLIYEVSSNFRTVSRSILELNNVVN